MKKRNPNQFEREISKVEESFIKLGADRMTNPKIVQTAGRDALGTFAPEFAHFNDDVLFGENWMAEGLGSIQSGKRGLWRRIR